MKLFQKVAGCNKRKMSGLLHDDSSSSSSPTLLNEFLSESNDSDISTHCFKLHGFSIMPTRNRCFRVLLFTGHHKCTD